MIENRLFLRGGITIAAIHVVTRRILPRCGREGTEKVRERARPRGGGGRTAPAVRPARRKDDRTQGQQVVPPRSEGGRGTTFRRFVLASCCRNGRGAGEASPAVRPVNDIDDADEVDEPCTEGRRQWCAGAKRRANARPVPRRGTHRADRPDLRPAIPLSPPCR